VANLLWVCQTFHVGLEQIEHAVGQFHLSASVDALVATVAASAWHIEGDAFALVGKCHGPRIAAHRPSRVRAHRLRLAHRPFSLNDCSKNSVTASAWTCRKARRLGRDLVYG
jgi:hypothetical protein